MNFEIMASPANVEMAAFDALWANELSPENDAFFTDLAMPMKPIDLANNLEDEDAWLVKMGFAAVRDIRVTSESIVKQESTPSSSAHTALTIDVHAHHHEDEDATSVLLEPIMGSPVDELDAMTAFMVDDVDPFQEVVVTSDDEPMSPVPASAARASRNSVYYTDAEEKKIDKLRTTVQNLEKMYYARSHGRSASASDVDIARVKMVRSLERLQRIACDVAQENYGFRQGKMPQRVREELLLQDLSCVLKGDATRAQLCGSIADKLCSDAIVTTARRSAEAAMGLPTDSGDNFMGWACRSNSEAATGEFSFTAKKEFTDKTDADFARITAKSWELIVSSEEFASFMNSRSAATTTRPHVLKRLSDDVMLVAFDSVKAHASDDFRAAKIERDVCVAFRVRTTSGMMVAVSSMPASLFETTVQQVDSISYVERGMRWMQFSQASASGGLTVTAGGRVRSTESAKLDALAMLVQWERACVAPMFQL